MTAMGNEAQAAATDVEQLAAKILSFFPQLGPDSRRVAVTLYRLLSKGDAVTRQELAEATGLAEKKVEEILGNWPGIFYEEEKIIGFWGLTPRPFGSHLLKFDGRTEYAWCAWDTLFIPEIIGKTVEVESIDPETGAAIRMTVGAEAVKNVSPAATVMSIVEPTEDMTSDVVAKFCHFVHFFASAESGEKWVAKNPGTLLISLKDAFDLAKRRNRGQFQEALDTPAD